jgi:hypothetical protein
MRSCLPLSFSHVEKPRVSRKGGGTPALRECWRFMRIERRTLFLEACVRVCVIAVMLLAPLAPAQKLDVAFGRQFAKETDSAALDYLRSAGFDPLGML